MFIFIIFIVGLGFKVGSFGISGLLARGNLTIGASFGLFTFGLTSGAAIWAGACTVTGISNLALFTSFGETLEYVYFRDSELDIL